MLRQVSGGIEAWTEILSARNGRVFYSDSTIVVFGEALADVSEPQEAAI